jgi:hypothetical protein
MITGVYNYYHLHAKFYPIFSSYVDEITWDHGFWYNRSMTGHIFCIHQILVKKWQYNGSEHQFFIDFEKASDLIRREIQHMAVKFPE